MLFMAFLVIMLYIILLNYFRKIFTKNYIFTVNVEISAKWFRERSKKSKWSSQENIEFVRAEEPKMLIGRNLQGKLLIWTTCGFKGITLHVIFELQQFSY